MLNKWMEFVNGLGNWGCDRWVEIIGQRRRNLVDDAKRWTRKTVSQYYVYTTRIKSNFEKRKPGCLNSKARRVEIS